MKWIVSLAAAAGVLSSIAGAPAIAGETPSPPGARVWIIWPKDGEVIHGGKLWVRMGAKGIGIAPAGVIKPNTGHQHLIIDRPLPSFDEDIPADKNHLHFGGGQTEARIELPPGKHTLQVLMGDQDHIPHNPPLYSERITVIVP
jgi:hypothetical protein